MSLRGRGEIIARGDAVSVESAASALFSATASGRRLDLHIKDLVVAICEDVGCGRHGVVSCFAVTPKILSADPARNRDVLHGCAWILLYSGAADGAATELS